MDPALILFFSSGSKIQNASQIPSQIHFKVKIRNIIQNTSEIPSEITKCTPDSISKFLGPKKIGQGGP